MTPTNDVATRQIAVAAPLDRCFEVISDFESYPQWSAGVDKVEVLERDGSSRPQIVKFHMSAMGRETSCVLTYDYSNAPKVLRWNLVEGDIEKALVGEYILDSQGSTTEVAYRLQVDLKIAVPGFVKRRMESHVMNSALENLKMRIES